MTAPPVSQHRVFGEDAPTWLIGGVAVLGTMASMSAAVMLIPSLPDTLPSRFSEIWTDLGSGLPLAKDRATPPVPAPDDIAGSRQAIAEQWSAGQVDESTVRQAEIDSTGIEASAAPEAAPGMPSAARKPDVVSSVSDAKTQPGATPVAEHNTLEPAAALRVQKPTAAESASEEAVATSVPSSVPNDVRTLEIERQAMMAVAGAESEEQQPRDDDSNACAPVFSIRFGRGGVRPLGADLTAKTAQLAEWLRARPDTKVYVEGHTDSSGPEELNLLLSYRRANAMASRLVEAGVARNQLSIRAYGESQPLEQFTDPGQNRRVVLSVDDGQACLPQVVEH